VGLCRREITDNELAAVMGHEIAHALREHVREEMGRQQATAIGTAVGSAVLEHFTGVNVGKLGHTFTQAMFVLPNSRENEQEADRIGVELAARAGYDPRAAVAVDTSVPRDAHPRPAGLGAACAAAI
jgi:predicted Zn-dependent protease